MPPPPPAPSGALPARLTPFIGRTDELDSLAARDGRRLVTLTGPGGVGKTRLAPETAGTYEGPVHLAELASVRGESTVAVGVLTALGAHEAQLRHTPAVPPTDPKGRFAALVEHCAGRRMPLVLDNREHAGADTGGGFRPFTARTEAAIRVRAGAVLRAALPPEAYARGHEEGTGLSPGAAAPVREGEDPGRGPGTR
ncbi:hypothetical protein GCM10010275_35570 [Streptomyces litmocidini]|uniref:hypothetical protein n=1 Tax=Streptomyces litmocidini TaxID=67318 RepID=UPI0019B2DB1A|nr:hypothetical protein [Streptomyces litmocidini]GGU94766.1 hypothetical protein GCM10010275_35570 [Streptomyces litmocidini]